MAARSKEADAWFCEEADADTRRAFTALSDGVASGRQQVIALNWLIHKVCRTHDISARPDALGGTHATYIAEGRRMVGLKIINLTNKSLVAEKPEHPSQQENTQNVS